MQLRRDNVLSDDATVLEFIHPFDEKRHSRGAPGARAALQRGAAARSHAAGAPPDVSRRISSRAPRSLGEASRYCTGKGCACLATRRDATAAALLERAIDEARTNRCLEADLGGRSCRSGRPRRRATG